MRGEPDTPLPMSAGTYRAPKRVTPSGAPVSGLLKLPRAPVPFSPVEPESYPKPENHAAFSGHLETECLRVTGDSGSFNPSGGFVSYSGRQYPSWLPCATGQTAVFDTTTGQYVTVNEDDKIIRPDLIALLSDLERQQLRAFYQFVQPFPLGDLRR